MKAFIVLEKPLDARSASQSFLDGREEFQETFGHYPGASTPPWRAPAPAGARLTEAACADVIDRPVWSTPGDARCARAAAGRLVSC